jgi:peptide/nickel transport system permease protein
MLKRVTIQVAEVLATALGVVTVVFLLIRLAGDPVAAMLPAGASQEQIEQLRSELGYDNPLIVQYFVYLRELIFAGGGDSTLYSVPAMDVVLDRAGATASLAVIGLGASIVVGCVLGLIAALKRGGFVDTMILLGSSVAAAMPSFWIGIILILVFAVQLGWLPVGGWGSPAAFVLPVVTLVFFIASSVARVFRSSLLSTLNQDYVKMARSKGASEAYVVLRHVAPNALLPLITVVGLQMGSLLGGAVVTEVVFSWPGVGQLMVQAIESRDFPVIQTGVLVLGLAFILVNLLTDVMYGVADPRVRRRVETK